MVFNMEGVTGLKTGNTNRAGYCLTVSLPVRVGGEGHDLILVMLGAESVEIRGQAAEILLRWAQQVYAD
jgi:D-alanyl-D-alanine carboxypeptidase